jgi:uncharacterized membrane protein YphA (DoxX/SURF4 family)
MVGFMNAPPAIAPFALAIRTLISLVFLTAAYGKLRHWAPFQGVVANYRLLPPAMAAPAAYLIPPAELLLGAALLSGIGLPWAEPCAAALLLLFALAMGINLRRGRRDIDCGCFQSALKQTLSWILVTRNVILALLTGLALLSHDGPDDLLSVMNGYLAGAILFIILQALGTLWSISPAWRRNLHENPGTLS